MFSGSQPRQIFRWRVNNVSGNISVLVIRELITRTEMIFDMYWFTRHLTIWSRC